MTDRRRWLAGCIDVVAVVVFAAAGRRSHDGGSGVAGVLSTAAPFLIALGAGWLVVVVRGAPPTAVRTGVGLWAGTVVAGLVLRRVAWDRGTAVSFVIVTALVLGLLLVGWRIVRSLVRGRSEIRSASPPSRAGR